MRPAKGAMFDGSSWSWRLNSRWFVLIGGARAAILQVAEPRVAAGVAQHSGYRTDPLGRLERTLDSMLAIGFGTPERRRAVLDELAEVHRSVRGRTSDGRAYTAMDPALQQWVLATLVDTVMEVERRYLGRLREVDRERYYDETRVMADAFGIPDRLVPGDLRAFREYFADTVASLAPDDDSRTITKSLLQPGLRWVPDAAFVPIDWVTLELLPTRMRRELRLRDLTPGQLTAVRAAQVASRRTLPLLPEVLATNPLNRRAIAGRR